MLLFCRVIAGSYAKRDELTAIFAGIAEGGGGLFEILEDFADVEKEMDWIGKPALLPNALTSCLFCVHFGPQGRPK